MAEIKWKTQVTTVSVLYHKQIGISVPDSCISLLVFFYYIRIAHLGIDNGKIVMKFTKSVKVKIHMYRAQRSMFKGEEWMGEKKLILFNLRSK